MFFVLSISTNCIVWILCPLSYMETLQSMDVPFNAIWVYFHSVNIPTWGGTGRGVCCRVCKYVFYYIIKLQTGRFLITSEVHFDFHKLNKITHFVTRCLMFYGWCCLLSFSSWNGKKSAGLCSRYCACARHDDSLLSSVSKPQTVCI